MVQQVPNLVAGHREDAAPEHGAPEHVQQDARARHSQQGSNGRAADGREQNGRQESNAAHAELLEYLDDTARAPGEYRGPAQPALALAVPHPRAANARKHEYAGHHTRHSEA